MNGFHGALILLGVAAIAGALALYFYLVARRQSGLVNELVERLGSDPQELQRSRRSFLLRYGERFDQSEEARDIATQLQQANLPLKPSEFIFGTYVLGLGIFIVATVLVKLSVFISFPLAVLGARHLPRIVLRARHDQYVEAFTAQLVEVASLMSNSLRAGLSVQQAVALIGDDLPDPAGKEFGFLDAQFKLGASLEEGLANMMERLPSDDLRVLFTAILVQKEVGGNLAKALSDMSYTMTERATLRDEMKAMTAQARYSSLLIPVLPIGMLLLLRNAMPDFVAPLFETIYGWIVLAIFGGLQVAAFLLVRRIAAIKV